MGLEAATYIHELDPSNPVGASDPKAQGDDHIRMLKSSLQNTLPNVEGVVNASHTELNILDGATLSTAELNILDGVTATTAEVNITDRDSASGGYGVSKAGYLGIPQVSQSANYTCVLSDAGKQILHPNGGGSGDTFTIPANAAVAFEIGTAITFINRDSNNVSIAITTDTLILAGGTSTGTRTLAQNGIATVVKVEATVWLISGTGLT